MPILPDQARSVYPYKPQYNKEKISIRRRISYLSNFMRKKSADRPRGSGDDISSQSAVVRDPRLPDLLIVVRMVESHITNIYEKLRIGRRLY